MSESSPLHPLLHAGLQSQLLLPADPEYAARQASYWSNSAKLTPAGILRPRSAADVSTALDALVAADQKFALRSGGHTQYAGANNIGPDGVTIDLGLLNWTRFDAATETVEIGPGARWKEVYGALQEHGRVVAGGRDGNVGVAGLLLGGGKTFFAAQRGFACDDVVRFEVVLPGGRIVTASAEQNPDLFRALKGGSNNFGIVTNFTMRALVCDRVWAGLNFFPKEVTADATQALVRFTDRVHEDPDSHLLFFLTYLGALTHQPAFHDIVVVAAYVQLAGIPKARAYQDFLALPSIMDTTKLTTIPDVVSEYDIAPPDYYNTFFTATLKNNPLIVTKAAELHSTLVTTLRTLIPTNDFITQCLLQPLPTLFGHLSTHSGDNIMGVSAQPVNGLLFVAVVMVRTPELEAIVYPMVREWVDTVKSYAATLDGNLDWVYLNYADGSQKVLEGYGAENVRRMREVAGKYDPGRVFQRLCRGGFKIGDVDME
ncbi:FAD-binding oxidoreductase [Aspergillus ibericus CBS 121593]|uniref:FAD-binding domain-containing protein n=1 Tax=Aspergillus ibericus CBS 121593 TaxID=1448316 RepID=A0A395HC66_9EURO|nr:FAD-binding domain-containing protein [Aspergillus ibericus CBS 121593]RAL04558.1 FAD-binding domain-containing protein [Aspergillus ibericus CBS 121593]